MQRKNRSNRIPGSRHQSLIAPRCAAIYGPAGGIVKSQSPSCVPVVTFVVEATLPPPPQPESAFGKTCHSDSRAQVDSREQRRTATSPRPRTPGSPACCRNISHTVILESVCRSHSKQIPAFAALTDLRCAISGGAGPFCESRSRSVRVYGGVCAPKSAASLARTRSHVPGFIVVVFEYSTCFQVFPSS